MSSEPATIVERHPGVVIAQIRATSLDENNIAAVRSEVAAAGAKSPTLPVAIDMQNVEFLPSLSLAGLIQLSQLFKANNQRLLLAHLQPAVRQIFSVTRLDRLFELKDDLSAMMS